MVHMSVCLSICLSLHQSIHLPNSVCSLVRLSLCVDGVTYIFIGYWRLNNFTVEVVSSDKKTTHVCGVYSKPEPVPRGGSYTFNCSNASGKYVYIKRIEGSRDEQYMTLCEVKIDGYVKATTPFVQPATPALYNLEDGGLSSIGNMYVRACARACVSVSLSV